MAGVSAAAVGTTVMFYVIMLPVMVAQSVWIVVQTAFQKCFHRLIRRAGHAGIQMDTGFGQSRARAAADAAADQRINAVFF